jgi:Na+-transporting methylmalonyl-CoA/oxaloacetate decarboxylase gamma subunit
VGLVELFVSVLIVGISAINAAVPSAAWSRSRDPRFLLLAAANGVFALLGAVWTWGQLPTSPPVYAQAQLPVLGIALVIAFLLLATTLWPRHA